jgi:hypothetical protein
VQYEHVSIPVSYLNLIVPYDQTNLNVVQENRVVSCVLRNRYLYGGAVPLEILRHLHGLVSGRVPGVALAR